MTAKRGSATRKVMLQNLFSKGNKKDAPDQVVDENTMNMMYEIQEENVHLKRSKLFNRITKLSNESPHFTKFMKSSTSNAETQDISRMPVLRSLKLTDEEQAELHNSVNEINGIKQSLRHKMCKAKVIRIGEQHEETSHNSLRSLNKVKLNISKINHTLFGGQPEGELSTSFQKFMENGIAEKVDKAANWHVIGRVKIKPSQNQDEPRVERIYLNESSAEKVLRALPILPSPEMLITLP
jgi:hypothetical protein